MIRLGDAIQSQTNKLAQGNDASRLAKRIAEVHAMFADAAQALYHENAVEVLSHVNAVYIKDEEGQKTLSLYVDDGSFRWDLYNQQHFLMLWLKERHGEQIDVVKTYPSRLGMRKRHPFQGEKPLDDQRKRVKKTLTRQEREHIERTAEDIADPWLRRRFIDAMAASLQHEFQHEAEHDLTRNSKND